MRHEMVLFDFLSTSKNSSRSFACRPQESRLLCLLTCPAGVTSKATATVQQCLCWRGLTALLSPQLKSGLSPHHDTAANASPGLQPETFATSFSGCAPLSRALQTFGPIPAKAELGIGAQWKEAGWRGAGGGGR